MGAIMMLRETYAPPAILGANFLVRGLAAARAGFLRLVLIVDTWSERRAQRFALAALDDRGLRDIGLSRSEAGAECDKPFWRV